MFGPNGRSVAKPARPSEISARVRLLDVPSSPPLRDEPATAQTEAVLEVRVECALIFSLCRSQSFSRHSIPGDILRKRIIRSPNRPRVASVFLHRGATSGALLRGVFLYCSRRPAACNAVLTESFFFENQGV
jgi:hypothetical protein